MVRMTQENTVDSRLSPEGPGDEATPVQACVDVVTACFIISSCKLLECLSNSVEEFAR